MAEIKASIRIDKDIYEALKEMARRDDRSFQAYAGRALAKHVTSRAPEVLHQIKSGNPT